MRESFVFHSEYIEDLPEEYKEQFLKYTYEYGIHETVPQLKGLELSIWKKIQRRIDGDRESYEIRKQKLKEYKEKWKKNQKEDNNENDSDDSESFGIIRNDSDDSESSGIIPTNTHSVYVSVFDNVYVSVFEYVSVFVSVYVSVSDIDAFAQDTHTAQFPIKLFNLFKNADLPCSKKNLVNFIKTDFKNAVEYLAKSDIYKDFTVQDITTAVENFVQIVSASDTYEGYKHKINLYSLVQKKWFYELINGNIDFFKIHDNTQKTHENVIKYHDLCPVCKTRTADWMNEKGKYFCSNCNQYFEEVIYE